MKHIVHKDWEQKPTIPTSKIPSNLCMVRGYFIFHSTNKSSIVA